MRVCCILTYFSGWRFDSRALLFTVCDLCQILNSISQLWNASTQLRDRRNVFSSDNLPQKAEERKHECRVPNGMAIWVQAPTLEQATQWHGCLGAFESESVYLSVKVSQSNLLLRQAVRSLTSPSWVQVDWRGPSLTCSGLPSYQRRLSASIIWVLMVYASWWVDSIWHTFLDSLGWAGWMQKTVCVEDSKVTRWISDLACGSGRHEIIKAECDVV